MLIRFDPDSPVGLSDQIASNVRGAIVAGTLKRGERLPAARQLAISLDVNMHTVLRAYSVLRAEGLIELRRGRGAHVRADLDVDSAALDEQIRSLVSEARRLGLSSGELLTRLQQVAT